MRVEQLTTKNKDFYQIREWFRLWWQEEENLNFLETDAIMERSLNKDGYPQTWAVYDEDRLVGVFQFTLFDLHVRPNLYPWLANVYVKEEERGKGYSKFLLESAVSIARNLGIKKLWLFTTHVGLYERYGFEFVEEVDTVSKEPREQRLYAMEL